MKNIVSLFLSEEAEPGSGGDRPVRNNLTNRNGRGENITSPNPFSHSNCLCLKKRFASKEARRETTIINPKKGQRILGQDSFQIVSSEYCGLYIDKHCIYCKKQAVETV